MWIAMAIFFSFCFFVVYEHYGFYCLTTFIVSWFLHWANFEWGCWFCIVFWRTLIRKEVLELRIRRWKFNDEKKLSTLILVVIQCGFFIVDYSHLSVVFGVWTTFSIDGGKMPLDWKLYDLEKLINFQCAMSFNRRNKSSKVVCKGQNHGCDEKT